MEAVNNFAFLYKTSRAEKLGASEHREQDLYRAMLIFACAGLDVFVKRIAKTKLHELIERDGRAAEKFKDYVKNDLKKDDRSLLTTIASVLIDQNPRNALLQAYIKNITKGSLQSYEQLFDISNSSGLDTSSLIVKNKKALTDAFEVRNKIVHEMDINISDDGARQTPGYRTRIQRSSSKMEKHTKDILELAQNLFLAYKKKFLELKIGVDKKQPPSQNVS